jgi:hypothetical protein
MEAKIRPTREMPSQWPDVLPNNPDGTPQRMPKYYWETIDESTIPVDSDLFRFWKLITAFLDSGAFLAGGFMVDSWMSKTPKDIDLYFNCTEAVRKTLRQAYEFGYHVTEEHLSALENGAMQIILTHDNGYIPINIVNAEYRSTVQSFMERFDLTACMIGMQKVKGQYQIIAASDWQINFDIKIMKYNFIHNWMATKKRTLKYSIKGFKLEESNGMVVLGDGTSKYY